MTVFAPVIEVLAEAPTVQMLSILDRVRAAVQDNQFNSMYIEQYGADPANSAAENDAALVDAFAWLNGASRRVLMAGAGNFNIGAPLPTMTRSDSAFVGSGREVTQFTQSSTSNNSNFVRIGTGAAGIARIAMGGFRFLHQNVGPSLAGYAMVVDGAADVVIEDIRADDVAGVLDVGPTLASARMRMRDVRGSWRDNLNHRIMRFQRFSGLLFDDVVVYGSGDDYRTVPTFDFSPIGICDTINWNKVTAWTRAGSQYGMFVNADRGTFVNAWFNELVMDKTGKDGAAVWIEQTAANEATEDDFWKVQNIFFTNCRSDTGGDDGIDDGSGGRSVYISQGSSNGFAMMRGFHFNGCLWTMRDQSAVETVKPGTDVLDDVNINGCSFREAIPAGGDDVPAAIKMGSNRFKIADNTSGFAERNETPGVTNFLSVTSAAIDEFIVSGNMAYNLTGAFAIEPAYAAASDKRVFAANTPLYGRDAAEEVIAWMLVPDENATGTRTANKNYLQALINANPGKTIVIPQLGTGVIHFNGSLVWPDLYPPLLRMTNPAVDLHSWSVDTQTVSYWKSSTGDPITMAEGALGGGAVQQTLYFRNSDGKQVTQAESVILGGGNFTTATTANIKAFIFWMGSCVGRGPRIKGGKITCRFDGDTEKARAIYLERTKSTGTSDAPVIEDVVIGRNGAWTPSTFTLKAFDVGYELRGFALAELDNVAYSGIEPYQAPDGNLLTARFTKAAILVADSWNGLACINPIISNSSLFAAFHGILAEGEFMEGGKVFGCNVQEINQGVRIDNLAGTTQVYFTVTGTHLNANYANVVCRGMRFLIVDGCYFAIKRTSGEANTYAVKIEGFATAGAAYRAFGFQITHNIFNAIAVTGYSYGIHADYVTSADLVGNRFVSMNKPLYFTANTSGINSYGNSAEIHSQESVASKLAYVGSDFMTDLGAGDKRQIAISSDATVTSTVAGRGTVVDTAALTATRTRNLLSDGMSAGELIHYENRTTGGFAANVRDGLSAASIAIVYTGQRATFRWTGTAFTLVGVRPLSGVGASRDVIFATDAVINHLVSDGAQVYHTGTLTADRNFNLSSVDAYSSAEVTVSRTGAGAFNLVVRDLTSATTLANLAVNQAATFRHNGTAWKLKIRGTM